MFEILTWRHLGLHDKPIFLVDVAGYWDPLRRLFDHLATTGFTAPLVPRLLNIVPGVAELMRVLAGAQLGGSPRSEWL
jgi:predicted Rossmann-fold nucleotide-binding protein